VFVYKDSEMLDYDWLAKARIAKDEKGYKNKTPVISRSFNHQSKNEQLLKLLLRLIFLVRMFNFIKI